MPAELEKDMGRWLRYQTPLTVAMESVALTGMQHRRSATWAEAKTGARGLRASSFVTLPWSVISADISQRIDGSDRRRR